MDCSSWWGIELQGDVSLLTRATQPAQSLPVTYECTPDLATTTLGSAQTPSTAHMYSRTPQCIGIAEYTEIIIKRTFSLSSKIHCLMPLQVIHLNRYKSRNTHWIQGTFSPKSQRTEKYSCLSSFNKIKSWLCCIVWKGDTDTHFTAIIKSELQWILCPHCLNPTHQSVLIENRGQLQTYRTRQPGPISISDKASCCEIS